MKLTRLLYSTLYLMLFTTLATFAQRGPVQSIAAFHPPNTVMVPLWYSGPTDRISVTLTNQDMQRAITKVRLRMRLKGGGVYITSKQGVNYPLIDLPAGVPVRLSQSDLEPYLNPQNWNFESGLSYNSYVRSYTLPQGQYEIAFDALEANDSSTIWAVGQPGHAFLSLNDPPFLNMPRKAENIVHRDPSNIIFQWTPRHITDPYMSFNTEYEFSMMELIDKGMTPEVAFMQNGVQPFYQERCQASTFLYGAMQPLLTPGRRYAWRIGVKSLDGTTLSNFNNDGYSEVYWFTYQTDCMPPVTIQAEPMSVAARITWTPVFATTNGVGTGGNYVVEYRPYKMDGGEWWPTKTTSNKATLTNLKPDRTYEYRVGRSCDDNLSFVYSDIKRFKTNVEQTYGDCEKDDGSEPPKITNREPIQTLHAGDIITSGGGMRTRIVQVSGQGSFTGYGYATMPLTKHAQFKVKFANIIINTDKQLIGGFIETTYDPLEKQVADVDKVMEGGQTAPLASTQPDPPSATVPFEISGSDAIQLEEETSADTPSSDTDAPAATAEIATAATAKPVKLNIKNPDGSVKQVAVGKLPATIQDKNNTVYKVEKGKNGKALVTKVGKQESSRPSSMLAGATSSTIKATVAFKSYPEKQRYAFDEYQAIYAKSMLYKAKYESLPGNYFVSSKAIVEGQADVVKAVLNTSDKNIVADSVRFVNHQGMRYSSKLIGDNTFEVSIMGGTAGQAQALYAVYPQGKTTVSLGKLLITSYAIKTHNVVLVPVNGASVDKQAISEQLNAIYNPVGMQFEVSQDASFDDTSWDINGDGKLAVKGSGLFSTLTSEMRALNQAYTRNRNVEGKTVYLFILNSADESVAGDMPRAKQFGYLFSGNDGKLAAHEIGHGLFNLKHSFDGFGFKQGELANNLMDYPAGDQLSKFQWDQLRDPGMVISIFERERDGELPVVQIVKCVSSAAIDVAFNYTFKWLELCWDDKPVAFTDYSSILGQINKAELLSSAAIACGASVIPWPTDKAKMIAAMTAAFGSGGTAITGDLYTQYGAIAAQNPKLGASDIIKQLDFGQALSKGGMQAAIAGVATGITVYSLDHPKFKNFANKLRERVNTQGTAFLARAGLSEEAIDAFLAKFGVKGLGRNMITLIHDKIKILEKETLYLNQAETFLNSEYLTAELIEDVFTYRRFGGNANLGGTYVSSQEKLSRKELALIKDFNNSMRFEARIKIPRGEKINIGKVGPWPPKAPEYMGGADQIIIRYDYPANLWVQSIKDFKTGKVYTYGQFKQAFPNLCR